MKPLFIILCFFIHCVSPHPSEFLNNTFVIFELHINGITYTVFSPLALFTEHKALVHLHYCVGLFEYTLLLLCSCAHGLSDCGQSFALSSAVPVNILVCVPWYVSQFLNKPI